LSIFFKIYLAGEQEHGPPEANEIVVLDSVRLTQPSHSVLGTGQQQAQLHMTLPQHIIYNNR
jgi:hypothetical protein